MAIGYEKPILNNNFSCDIVVCVRVCVLMMSLIASVIQDISAWLRNFFRLHHVYADDLILIMASLGHLHIMVDKCIGELDTIEMKANAKKVPNSYVWFKL